MTPPFLTQLGLGADCDERALRRAYAKRLKQIDPGADPQAFQAVREAYEAAQVWLRHREQAAAAPEALAEVPAEAPPPVEPAPEPSHTVFTRFLAEAQAGFADEHQARRALDEALADPGLINLDARATFEARVGALLMNGWQPGHEYLFVSAAECFAWDRDPGRLRIYGQLGAVLDAAVREWQMFLHHSGHEGPVQRHLIKQLRTNAVPDARALRNEAPVVFQLFDRYPHWMRAITSLEQAKRWHAAYEALASNPAPTTNEARSLATQAASSGSRHWSSTSSSSTGGGFGWQLLWLLLVLPALVKACFEGPTQPPRPPAWTRSSEAARLGPSAPLPWPAAPSQDHHGLPSVLGSEGGAGQWVPVQAHPEPQAKATRRVSTQPDPRFDTLPAAELVRLEPLPARAPSTAPAPASTPTGDSSRYSILPPPEDAGLKLNP